MSLESFLNLNLFPCEVTAGGFKDGYLQLSQVQIQILAIYLSWEAT